MQDKRVELTDDSLANIKKMVPLLDDKSREAMSHLMFGCLLGEMLSDSNRSNVGEEIVSEVKEVV